MSDVQEKEMVQEAALMDNLAAGLGIPAETIAVTTLDKVFTTEKQENADIVDTLQSAGIQVDVEPGESELVAAVINSDGSAIAISDEIFPDEGVYAEQVEEAVPPALHGSSVLPATIDIKGNIVQVVEVVQYAFAKSKMTVEIWNKLSKPKREALIAAAVVDLRKELKPVPKNQDGKPKLTLEEKQRIKDNKFAREVAGQQWAGLAALKGQIQFAPDPESEKKSKSHNGKPAHKGHKPGFKAKQQDGQKPQHKKHFHKKPKAPTGNVKTETTN